MDKITLPPNGLPQGLTNIPFGQVFVLTDPSQGITSTINNKIGAVISIAGSLDQSHIVYAIPVDAPELWDCYICKVKTKDGVQILVSDKDSLIEMLCEFWGLDYAESIKKIIIRDRYKGHMTIGGESHPVRIPVGNSGHTSKEDERIILQCLPVHSKPDTLSDIRNAFQDIFYHNLGISIDEITHLYEEVKKSTKSYHLHIVVERDDKTGKITNCKFILEDNLGNKKQLMKPLDKKGKNPLEEWEVQWKALYLTFILFKEGLTVREIGYNEDFYQTFLKILGQLPKGYSKPDKMTLWENSKSKFSKIRKSIMEATNDTYARELFSIDGYSEDVYGVAGATDENRETIKREFGL